MTLARATTSGLSLFLRECVRLLGPKRVSTEWTDRWAHAVDSRPVDQVRLWSGRLNHAVPGAVLWPETAEQVPQILELAQRWMVPIAPSGGLTGAYGSARGFGDGVRVSSARLDSIRGLGPGFVEVEGGVRFERMEAFLREHRLDCGYLPLVREPGTVGGLVAEGRLGFGLSASVAERLAAIQLATPQGLQWIEQRVYFANWISSIVGSEGTLGFITAVRWSTSPVGEPRRLSLFRLRSFELALEALRSLVQAGFRTSIAWAFEDVRQRDGALREGETGISARAGRALQWFKSGVETAVDLRRSSVRLILGFDGAPRGARVEEEAAIALLKREGGEYFGPTEAETLWSGREREEHAALAFRRGWLRQSLFVCATWDRVLPLVAALRAASRGASVRLQARFPNRSLVHIEVALSIERVSSDVEAANRLEQILMAVMSAAHDAGGTVGFGHGLGDSLRGAIDRELGPGGVWLGNAQRSVFGTDGWLNRGRQCNEPFEAKVRAAQPATRPERAPLERVVGERNVVMRADRMVVRPPDVRALAAIARIARPRGWALWTDQNGALDRPDASFDVDLSLLDGVLRISEHAQFVVCEAGVLVERLEQLLSSHGLTLGPLHPQVLGRSIGSVLSNGQLVGRVSNAVAVPLAVEVLLEHGDRIQGRLGGSRGLVDLFFGSGGQFGIVTSVSLQVRKRRAQQNRQVLQFRFSEMELAVDAAQSVLSSSIELLAARLWPEGDFPWPGVRLAVIVEGGTSKHAEARSRVLSEQFVRKRGQPEPAVEADALGGRFDGAVQVKLPWCRLEDGFKELAMLTGLRPWADFMGATGATLVVPLQASSSQGVMDWSKEHSFPAEFGTQLGRGAEEIGCRLDQAMSKRVSLNLQGGTYEC